MADTPRLPSWRTDRRKTAERGYGGRWRKERAAFLDKEENALCAMCRAEGRTVAATVVDHKVAHKGDEVLMWDKANWQPLCKRHHDSDKQRMERTGRVLRAIDPDGWPI